jgi:hypothetical protein
LEEDEAGEGTMNANATESSLFMPVASLLTFLTMTLWMLVR